MAILGMAGFGAVRAVVDFHHNRVIIGFKDWRLEARPALILGMNVLGTVNTLMLDYPRAQVCLLPLEPNGICVGTCALWVASVLMHGSGDCSLGS